MWRTVLLILISLNYISSSENYTFNNKPFPKDFIFAVSTSAYQIEGAWNIDGKGINIWDIFTHRIDSTIEDKSNGDVACDSYHKYKTDVAMLKDLGVTHYRFSISWSRILPFGHKYIVNFKGVQYYKSLLAELKRNNIIPIVTIYHFDLPQSIEASGGFLNPSFVRWFTNYAIVAFALFGDDVKFWITFNEATFICSLGYGEAYYPPAKRGSGSLDYLCGHNLLKAHASAWHTYDRFFRKKQGGKIAISNSINYYHPASNSKEDREAAERKMHFDLGWFANPIFNGDYPQIMKDRVTYRSKLNGFTFSRLPVFSATEKKFIKGTSDFFCFNTYYSFLVEDIPEPDRNLISRNSDTKFSTVSSNAENGAWGMPFLLKWIQKHYSNPKILITENGFGINIKTENDTLEDDNRIYYIKSYLSRIRDAIDEGIQVIGYSLWSLMDNMEWTFGYNSKYGLYQVDFTNINRTRTPRKSASFYKRLCQTRCLVDKCSA